MELTYRTTIKASQRPAIRSSMDAYKIFLHSWDKGKIELVEQFKVLCLNRAFKVLGIYTVSSGSMCGTVVDVRQIFAPSLLGNASSIMIAHNHPSGEVKPSRNDRYTTDHLVKAGKHLEISVADHLIISPEGYYSFADEGLL